MAARVIHFGLDNCHRRDVLRRDGYEVTEPSSLLELITYLRNATLSFDAVVLSEDEEMVPASVLRAIRSETGAPVILFRRTNRQLDESGFTRVIEVLTSPVKWLHELEQVIAEHRSSVSQRGNDIILPCRIRNSRIHTQKH